MPDLAEGTVTFLFSDVEGSTQLLEQHGNDMGRALARHHELFAAEVATAGGAIFETVGDAVYAAFARPAAALAAALSVQLALAGEDWGSVGRLVVRIAIHTGAVERRGDHYFGPPLFRAARLMAIGHGEQVLLSGVTAALVRESLPPEASLLDLGQHRLKDLAEPEQVFQLLHPRLRSKFPSLTSLDRRPHNLPVQLSSFVGRESELAAIGGQLNDHRLVTLLGPGGIGKTRLALQAAAECLDNFADGAWFVDLAALRDPELVPSAIAAVLGLREQPGTPIATTLAQHLVGRQVLLVLDNLEQLLPDAARLVAELLAATSQVRVVATSRAPLRVRGEHEYAVAPLAVGEPEHLEETLPPATALLIERAAEIGIEIAPTAETRQLIATICARLDGVPLAIELAVARLRLFDLKELRDRLTVHDGGSLRLLTGARADSPDRQRTMHDTIAWSVGLLSVEQRIAFGRLSVFVGVFELAAGEAVLAETTDDPIGILEGLADHSLLVPTELPGGRRLRMLEPIREYAEAQLATSGGSDAARAAHARWIADMTGAAESMYRGPQHREALDRIASYVDDVRAALRWAFDQLDAEVGLRIAIAMGRYWDDRDTGEGEAWLERAVALPSVSAGPRMQLARRLGWIYYRRGDRPAARAQFAELVELGRRLGDVESVLSGLANLAFTALADGRLADARRHLDELDAEGAIETPWASSINERLRGRLEAESGNADAAARHFRRSEKHALESGDRGTLGATLHERGMAALWTGDREAAACDLTEAARIGREVGFKGVLAPALTHLAAVAARNGDVGGAAAAATEALAEFETLGGAEWLEDLFDASAWVALEAGRAEAAAILLGAAAVRWELIEADARPTDRAWHAGLVDRARSAAGPAWAAAETDGRHMLTPQAISFARQAVARETPR